MIRWMYRKDSMKSTKHRHHTPSRPFLWKNIDSKLDHVHQTGLKTVVRLAPYI